MAMHRWIKEHKMLDKMQAAFEIIPDQAMKPSDQIMKSLRKHVETIELSKAAGRIQAVMMVPYPPRIPIIMGGEIFNEKAEPILDYLLTRQAFKEALPPDMREISTASSAKSLTAERSSPQCASKSKQKILQDAETMQ
ncbi:MAG: hypothetical protein V8T87_01755 [Victivallales bacterium]